MGITFVGVEHADYPTDTVNKPSGVIEGDLMIAVAHPQDSHGATLPTPPAGWTVLYDPIYVSDAMWAQIVWKVAGPSEPSSYTWVQGGFSDMSFYVVAYRGDAALSIDVSAKANGLSDDLWDFDPGSNPLYAIPSIDPGFDQECLVAIALSLHQLAGNYLPVTDGYQTLAGYTSRYMQAGGANDPAIIIQDLIGAGCGVTGVLTGIKADDWSDTSFHIGLKEAGAAACGEAGFRDYCQSVIQT
jgi:hypothetical protein